MQWRQKASEFHPLLLVLSALLARLSEITYAHYTGMASVLTLCLLQFPMSLQLFSLPQMWSSVLDCFFGMPIHKLPIVSDQNLTVSSHCVFFLVQNAQQYQFSPSGLEKRFFRSPFASRNQANRSPLGIFNETSPIRQSIAQMMPLINWDQHQGDKVQ